MIKSLYSALLALGFSAASICGSAAATSHPNILIILTDDMGYGDLTCNGPGVGVQTVNIDKLAKQGTRFTQYYAPAPICSPSRAGLLTGRFPSTVRLNSYLQARAGNINCEQDDWLDPEIPTLPRVMKAAGYATAHVGKWHLGGGRDVTTAPKFAAYGYDEGVGTWESPEPDAKLGIKFAPWDKREEPGQVPRHKRTEYMVDRSLDFMRRHATQPWFITLWPDDVHIPHRPSPEMMAKYGASEDPKKTPRKNFQGVLEEYDRQIGRLLDSMTTMGLDQKTIVIFASDNGPDPPLGTERTGGYRGMKMSLYEGGFREPFIIRWPGHVPVGAVNNASLLCGIDLFPSLCKMAGVEVPSDATQGFSGEDMSPAFLGKQQKRTKPLYWEYGRKENGYGYPQVVNGRSPNVAVRDGDTKVIINADGSGREVYDIKSNPHETTGSVVAATAKVDEMTSNALQWRKSLPARQEY